MLPESSALEHNMETHKKADYTPAQHKPLNDSLSPCVFNDITVFLHTTSKKISPIWPLTTQNIVLRVVNAAAVIASLMELPQASLAYD